MNDKFEIKSNLLQASIGRVLLSEPLMQDMYFKRSVILLIEHSINEGTVGVILNKPLDVSFNELVKEGPKLDSKLFLGGPVQTDNVYFIHNLGEKIEKSLKITEGIYWGGDIEQVNELININVIDHTNIRFFVGYAGWDPKQLEKELKRNNWAIANSSDDDIWKLHPKMMWHSMVNKLGNDYNFWKNLPENPIMN